MDPITLALLGGGGTLLSSFLNSGAQSSVDAARSGVINAERQRQQGFDAETGKLNDQSLGRYSNFDTQMADKSKQLSDLFRAPVVTPNTQYTGAPLPPAQSDLVRREIAAKTGIADAYVGHQADTLGNLRSFGDLFGGIQRGQAKDAQLIGQVGGFKKGSSGVEQLELDNANRAGNDQKLWADIAGGLGKVALTAGLSGAFAPAAAATAGAPAVAAARFVPPANIFATGASPFLNYGRA